MDSKKKKLLWQVPFLLLLVIGTFWVARQRTAETSQAPYQKEEGIIFGTTYHVQYQCEHSLNEEITAQLGAVDASLSMFNPKSTIAQINNGTSDKADSLLTYVFLLSRTISQETNGAFDVTVAPLVNAWGFGFKNGEMPTDAQVDSLRQLVGWQSVTLQDGKIVKEHPGTTIDFSAVAKGYGSDLVAKLFDEKGITNYMIEIGGEIVVKGCNEKGEPWGIGVNKPIEDASGQNKELETIIKISDIAMATSGNYRNFYIKDGKKVAHTIDPKSGRPVQHTLLSATVFAPNCATADGYATSFMVMGVDSAKAVLAKHPELMAYLIYADGNGQNQVWHSPKLNEYIGK